MSALRGSSSSDRFPNADALGYVDCTAPRCPRAAGSRSASLLEAGARAPESASEKEVRSLSTKRSTGRKPKVTASPKGMMSTRPPKVGWGATGGESVGPYGKKLDSAWCTGEPANEWRSPETRGCRRETALPGRVQIANQTGETKADLEGHWVVGDRTTGKFRCGESGNSCERR